jgi:hypothetical protein
MVLILIMYINETALVTLDWYMSWLTYVKYSGLEDQAAAVIVTSEDTPLTTFYMIGVANLLTTLRLSIADSIMVTHFILRALCHSNPLFRFGVAGSFVIVAGKQQLFHSS